MTDAGTNNSNDTPPTYDDMEVAYLRIREQIHRTPVMTSKTLDNLSGKRLFFKCENFQKVGAFKFRGASNAVNHLTQTQATAAKKGVVTHSSGNHAQALALAAALKGIPATVIMPANATRVKREAVEAYGAKVMLCEPTLDAREQLTQQVIKETGAHLVHPYNDADVISGQGTVVLEFLKQMQELDTSLDAIITPVGGGGLLSGSCISAAHRAPDIALYGAEPKGADDAYQSFQAGEFIPQTQPRTIAEGLRSSLGSLTWPIIQQQVRGIVTVSEEEIISAMRLVWERMKLVVETSGVVGLAGAMGVEFQELGYERVGIVLTGGNVDLGNLPFGR